MNERASEAGGVRSLTVNVLIATSSLVLLAMAGEVILRFVVPVVYRPRVTRIDPILGWYHNALVSIDEELEGHKYHVSYNGHGYRSPEHSYTNEDGRRRVVVIGDSFVEGSEVGDDELFTFFLQQSIPNAEVINLGVYGYSTAQELLTLENVGLRYDPDLVVLVTISNDFTDNTRNFDYFGPAPRFILAGDSILFESTTAPAARESFRATNLPVPGVMSFLHRHSLLYYALNHYVYQRLIAEDVAALQRFQMNSISPEERAELYRRIVLRMKTVTKLSGAEFLVVFAYLRDEVRDRDTSPYADLVQRLSESGVETLDLFDDLRRAEVTGDTSLWYNEDIHWNRFGHREVSDILLPHIERTLDLNHQGGVGAHE